MATPSPLTRVPRPCTSRTSAVVDEASRQLGGAPVLMYAGSEHVAYWSSDCTRFAVDAFLADGTLPAVGTCS